MLVLAALVSGCSYLGLGDSGRTGPCASDPDSCMYEGHYEPGERDYAVQEAKRLNENALRNFLNSAD
jgi:hypothetical protein